jgi:hypothetical protein
MERYDDLDALLDHIWTYVETAADDSSHPFRTPTFGTAGMDRPNLRTVVLRQADADARLLGFHSDRRTQKIGEIRANDTVMWHGWDPERSEQLRLQGTATIHTNDAFASRMWQQGTPQELWLYARPKTPGVPTDTPESGIKAGVEEKAFEDLTREDIADGRPYFAAVRTIVEEIHWLHLHPEGHYRARFKWDGNAFDGTWVIP